MSCQHEDERVEPTTEPLSAFPGVSTELPASSKPPGEASEAMEFPWHSGKVLEQLNRQRRQGMLCDCTFVVDGVDFKAHKAVLAACSVYFRTLFLDQKDVVHLDISNAAGGFLWAFGHVSTVTVSCNTVYLIYFVGNIHLPVL